MEARALLSKSVLLTKQTQTRAAPFVAIDHRCVGAKFRFFRCQKGSGAVRVVDGHTAALFPPVGRGLCVSAAENRRGGSNSRPWEYDTYARPIAQQSTEKHGNTLKSSRAPFVPLTFLLILPVSYSCASFAAFRCRSGSLPWCAVPIANPASDAPFLVGHVPH